MGEVAGGWVGGGGVAGNRGRRRTRVWHVQKSPGGEQTKQNRGRGTHGDRPAELRGVKDPTGPAWGRSQAQQSKMMHGTRCAHGRKRVAAERAQGPAGAHVAQEGRGQGDEGLAWRRRTMARRAASQCSAARMHWPDSPNRFSPVGIMSAKLTGRRVALLLWAATAASRAAAKTRHMTKPILQRVGIV